MLQEERGGGIRLASVRTMTLLLIPGAQPPGQSYDFPFRSEQSSPFVTPPAVVSDVNSRNTSSTDTVEAIDKRVIRSSADDRWTLDLVSENVTDATTTEQPATEIIFDYIIQYMDETVSVIGPMVYVNIIPSDNITDDASSHQPVTVEIIFQHPMYNKVWLYSISFIIRLNNHI